MVDFDKLSQLSNDPVAFEKERWNIIKAHLDTLSPQRRMSALALQYQLDMKRESMTSEEFYEHCLDQIDLNLKRINTLIDRARGIIDDTTPDNVVHLDDFRSGHRIQKSP